MATLYLLILLLICIFYVDSQTIYNYTNFKQFGIKLPIELQQHISAVYNNKLYVFGGRNGTEFNDDTFSNKFWSLDLAAVNIELSSSKQDINAAALDLTVQWQLLTVIPPSYGPSSNGFIRCIHQCSTLINNYLYIVAPYSNSQTASSSVYRLDLSTDPPQYSGENNFTSSIRDVLGITSIQEPCVTSTADGQFIYIVGGNKQNAGNTADKVFIRYNVSADQWTALQDMNQNRQSSGCGVSYNNEEVYIFGGYDGVITSSFKNIDIYSVEDNTWTNTFGFLQYPTLPLPTFDIQCVSNPYDQTIICPGGRTQISYDEVIIYRTPINEIIDTIYLVSLTGAYGIAMYEFVNTGNDEASILFVSGGYDGGVTVFDTIQYLVLYNVPTMAPTSTPTAEPTNAPSTAPTQPPTLTPTDVPSLIPSNAPSMAPTVPETTIPVTQQGTASEKETETYGWDPDQSSQIDLMVVILISMIALSFQLNF